MKTFVLAALLLLTVVGARPAAHNSVDPYPICPPLCGLR